MANEELPKPWEPGYNPDHFEAVDIPRRRKGTGTRASAEVRAEKVARFKGKMTQQQPFEERSRRMKQAAKTRAAKLGQKGRASDKLMAASAVDKMEEHDFDPMDLLLDVAAGNALYDDHPYLPVLYGRLEEVEKIVREEEGYGLLSLVDQIRLESLGYLKDSYTPKEHRIKVAMELMQYARPKLKQIDHVGNGAGSGGSLAHDPLTEDEVAIFEEWFNSEY